MSFGEKKRKKKDMISGFLNNTQNACHPPATGHNDTAGYLAPSVVVRPGPVAAQRLADSLAVSVAAPAFWAADPLVVQHGVKGHGAFLSGRSAALQFGSNVNFSERNLFFLFFSFSSKFTLICKSDVFQKKKKKLSSLQTCDYASRRQHEFL